MKSKKLITKTMTLALIGATILGSSSSLYAKSNRPGDKRPHNQVSCKPGTTTKPQKPNDCTRPGTDNGTNNDTNTGTDNGTNNDTNTGNDSTTDTNVSTQTAYENRVLELINVERAKQGLKPLEMDESVRNVARLKSQDMQKNNYFSHTSPTYGTPFEMLKKYGISYKSAGENIAQGYQTPEQVVAGWMNSSGHRANILNANYTHIGIGYEANGNYWTQLFISK